jgi:hypothetical protein
MKSHLSILLFCLCFWYHTQEIISKSSIMDHFPYKSSTVSGIASGSVCVCVCVCVCYWGLNPWPPTC